MLNFKPMTLRGSLVQLETLNESHKEELYSAAQNEAIWTITSSKAYGNEFYPWFDKAYQALQEQQQLPFIVRHLKDNKIIGSTRFYNINSQHHRLAIGYTWYVPEFWGTYVNPECKLLLMTHAFETLQMNRVEFEIDIRNERSHAALNKLGAKQEGVLRQHMVLRNGHIRDTVVFSIIKSEWPEIKSTLQKRLK